MKLMTPRSILRLKFFLYTRRLSWDQNGLTKNQHNLGDQIFSVSRLESGISYEFIFISQKSIEVPTKLVSKFSCAQKMKVSYRGVLKDNYLLQNNSPKSGNSWGSQNALLLGMILFAISKIIFSYPPSAHSIIIGSLIL